MGVPRIAAVVGILLVSASFAHGQRVIVTDQVSPLLILSEQQANRLKGTSVYGGDGRKFGEVASFERGCDGTVVAMHAAFGGLFGFGQRRVRFKSGDFALIDDNVLLSFTAAEARGLASAQ